MKLKSKTICNYFTIVLKLIVFICTVGHNTHFSLQQFLNCLALIAGITSLSQYIIHIAQLRAGRLTFMLVMQRINHSKFGKILLRVTVMIVLLALIVQKQYRVKEVRLVVFFQHLKSKH